MVTKQEIKRIAKRLKLRIRFEFVREHSRYYCTVITPNDAIKFDSLKKAKIYMLAF